MKVFMRTCLFLMVLSFLVSHLKPEYFLANKIMGAILVAIGAFSGLSWVVGLFVFLARSEFKNIWWKIFWFSILLFVYYMAGPILFHFLVYEKRISLRKIKR